MLNILGIISSVLSKIFDNFNRSDGILGNTTSGNPWSILRGSWSISSNKATSSTTASSYALASVDIGLQNVVTSADITDGGPGVAFWVTDANSWWASSVNYRTSNYNYTGAGCCGPAEATTANGVCTCGTKSCIYTKTCYKSVIIGYNTTYTCPSGCFYSQSEGGCLYDVTENGCGAATPVQTPIYGLESCGSIALFCGTNVACNSPCNAAFSTTGNSYTCSSSYQSSGCAYTGTRYHTELKLYNNNSGSISTIKTHEINNNTSGSYVKVNSIKATTSGDLISIDGYANSGLTSLIGTSLTYTATGATKGIKTGIIKTPSDDSQGSTVDNFLTQPPS